MVLSASEINYDVRLLNDLILSDFPKELKLLLDQRGRMSSQRSCLSSPVLLVSDGISKCNIKYMNKPLLVPVFGP